MAQLLLQSSHGECQDTEAGLPSFSPSHLGEDRVEQQFHKRVLKLLDESPAKCYVDGGLQVECLLERERKGTWESEF